MDLRDEYKKEFSEITPDEAAMERIRRGVERKLAEPEVTKKKLPMRIVTIGGSIAACLVIGVTVITLTHGGKFATDGINNMTGGSAAPTAGSPSGDTNGNTNGNTVNANEFAGGWDTSNEPNLDADNGVCAEGVVSADEAGDGVTGASVTGAGGSLGDFPAEPTDNASARAVLTFDGDTLTFEHNGETAVYTALPNIDIGKYGDDNITSSEFDENSERIEAVLNGEVMFVIIKGDELLLFNSENAYKATFVKSE